MASTNKAPQKIYTHEGGPASRGTLEQQLTRSVMTCMLFEREAYEDGKLIAARIAELIPKVDPQKVADIAIAARQRMHLRHVPLLIVREMARHPEHKKLVAKTLPQVIQRADELSEFVALYWKEKKQPLSAQVKKGLAASFHRFQSYHLAKYDRAKAVKLRDVLMLCHPKPETPEQAALWKQLLEGKLETPDTWEVALSSGADKKATWERLIAEKKLGGLALLRNLRNMAQAQVPVATMREAVEMMRTDRILPFRFVAAAKYAVNLEPSLETAMLRNASELPKLAGETVLLIDVSGSMDHQLSAKSELTRLDAASALGMLLRETAENVRVFTFSDEVREVPPRRGFALRDAITKSQVHSGTQLGAAVRSLQPHIKTASRTIVVTDEQTADRVPAPQGKGYMVNVASAKNGVGYGAWTKIDGWSEAVVSYIAELEKDGECLSSGV